MGQGVRRGSGFGVAAGPRTPRAKPPGQGTAAGAPKPPARRPARGPARRGAATCDAQRALPSAMWKAAAAATSTAAMEDAGSRRAASSASSAAAESAVSALPERSSRRSCPSHRNKLAACAALGRRIKPPPRLTGRTARASRISSRTNAESASPPSIPGGPLGSAGRPPWRAGAPPPGGIASRDGARWLAPLTPRHTAAQAAACDMTVLVPSKHSRSVISLGRLYIARCSKS
jgi:hypothetical protein